MVTPDDPYPSQEQADRFKSMAAGESTEGLPSAPPVNVDVPAIMVDGAIAATAPVGATLTCTVGNWDGTPSDYAQAWLRDGAEVGAAASYVVQSGDEGHGITCVVTATNAAGSTAAPPSTAVAITATTRKGE